MKILYLLVTYANRLDIVRGGRRGRDRMEVGITTDLCNQCLPPFLKVVSSNPAHCEVYAIQHYVIKFVSDLLRVSGFLRVLWFPPPIKLTSTI